MPSQKILYVCNICGKDFIQEANAEICEKSHDNKVFAGKLNIISSNPPDLHLGSNECVPTRLDIETPRGAILLYKYEKVVRYR